MKKHAYIVSVKYVLGSHQEFVLLGKKIKKHGLTVRYLLSHRYVWMHTEPLEEVHFLTNSANMISVAIDTALFLLYGWVRLALIFRKEPPHFLCFYNIHPLNFVISRLAKVFVPDGIRAVFLHEPARPGKAAYRWKGRLVFDIIDFVQKMALGGTTDVILPSPVAQELFNAKYPAYNGRKHYAPILISDKPTIKTEEKRRYFSMIGRFNFAKRLDTFISAINYAAENSEDLEFQIVTASQIDEYLAKLTPAGKAKLHLVRKDQLSNEVISKGVAQSYAVCALQPMITQSGVLIVSFLNATPAIVQPIPGFTQFVKHKFNGWVLPEAFSDHDLVEAMKAVRNEFDTLSQNARQTYLDIFAEDNWEALYQWLLDSLKDQRN